MKIFYVVIKVIIFKIVKKNKFFKNVTFDAPYNRHLPASISALVPYMILFGCFPILSCNQTTSRLLCLL